MTSMRFDGKVVIITGAAGALGSAYCKLFAERGASLVVNDLPARPGQSQSGAEALVASLKESGAKAVADHNDVTNGKAIVETALRTFGRIDIVINNAGILQDVSFAKMTYEQWDKIMQVHLYGAFSVTHAAWPHMVKQKYGRIIMTSSAAGLYGNFGQANYSAAKLALVGFANALAKEGKRSNILVNTIAPVAGSPMTKTIMPDELVNSLKPAYVAPLVAKLTHESSTETGQIFEVGGGWVSQVRWQRSKGYGFSLADHGKYLTPEMIQSKWSSIGDFNNNDAEYPYDPKDSFGAVMGNLGSAEEKGSAELAAAAGLASSSAASSSGGSSSQQGSTSSAMSEQVAKHPEQVEYEKDFKSARVFRILADFISPELIKKVKGIFAFELTNEAGKTARYVVDLKNAPGKLYIGSEGKDVRPNATLILSDDNFMKAVNKEVQPQALYISNRLKVKGNLALAMKFETVTKPLEDLARSML